MEMYPHHIWGDWIPLLTTWWWEVIICLVQRKQWQYMKCVFHLNMTLLVINKTMIRVKFGWNPNSRFWLVWSRFVTDECTTENLFLYVAEHYFVAGDTKTHLLSKKANSILYKSSSRVNFGSMLWQVLVESLLLPMNK